MPPTKVMVVEDERIVALNLKQRLMKLGYEVSALATSGAQALSEIEKSRPDVVLMDIHIDGDIDGIETAARIPEEHQLPVIYLSAFSEEVTLARARGTRPYGYLLKPFSERELHATIQMVLERRRIHVVLADNERRLDETVAARTQELVVANQALRDSTAHRLKAEAALAEGRKMEAIGRLTGGIAHDFNNLLTVVSGCLELIEIADGERATIARMTGNARTAVARCDRLIKQMLMFARQQPLSPEVLDLRGLFAQFDSLLGRITGETIKLTMRLNHDVGRVHIDRTEFERAILNLVMNAHDAIAGAGTITVAAENQDIDAAGAERFELAAGAYVVVSVADSGCGIAPELLAKVFEPFFTTKGTGEGSGLGLSQVQGFAEESGGCVRIDSQPGRGTTVRLYLPKTTALPVPETAEAAPAALQRGENAGTVLVVEDDHQVRAMAVEGLRTLGYQVLTADGADGALEILRSDAAIAVLFSDIVMPGRLNGYELAAAARELRPAIKVVLTTGYTAGRPEQAANHPDVPVLEKPYRLNELAACFGEAAR